MEQANTGKRNNKRENRVEVSWRAQETRSCPARVCLSITEYSGLHTSYIDRLGRFG